MYKNYSSFISNKAQFIRCTSAVSNSIQLSVAEMRQLININRNEDLSIIVGDNGVQ